MATFPRSQPLGPIQTGDQSLVSDVPQFKAGAAGAAIGKGLMDVGDIGFRLSQEVARANDSRAFIEFDTDSELTLNNISTAITKERDETKWEGIAQQQLSALQKKYADRKMSGDARLRLDGAFAKFSSRAITDIQKRGFIQAGENVVTAAKTRLEMLVKNGAPDEDIDTVVSAMGEPQKEALAFEYKQRAQSSAWNITTNNAKFLATERGDLEGALALIDAGSESEDVKNLTRVAIKDLHERTVETKANKADAEYYGSILNRLADGTPKAELLADVEKRIQSGQVSGRSLDTFARLKSSLKGDIGATPDQLEELINSEVLPYNPEQDPTFKKAAEIQQKALELGLNPLQAQRFNALMANAGERHKTPESREANELLLEAKRQFEGMHKEGAVKNYKVSMTPDKDPAVIDAIRAPFALEHWGVESVTADKIRKLTNTSPSEALALFREVSNARKPLTKDGKAGEALTYEDGAVPPGGGGIINPDEIAKLSPQHISAFEKAIENKSYVAEDAALKSESGFAFAKMTGQIEDWFNNFKAKEKRNPTDEEVKGKMRQLVEPYLDTEGWEPALPKSKETISSAQSGAGLSAPLISRVKELEGFDDDAYGDFKQTSIGYGTRAKPGETKITREEAEIRLQEELAMHARRVDAEAKRYGVTLTQNQRDALTSFDFNTGSVKRVFERAKGDTSKIPDIMSEWKFAGGKPILAGRRAKEVAWFNEG
jgi:GH24 family phage-related lysozyme (muramidase)